ncbi:MAG: penicillin-binding protein 1A [Alphaproteobacteria bacterium]|nr:penicillin-binding protein 1A [Alphaproteobacteria bacterium]
MSKLFSTLVSYALFLVILGLIALLLIFSYYGKSVDDYRRLATYEPPITSRLYASDGRLLAEYAAEKRAFVPYEAIPKPLVQAFISAEDKKFFTHGGIDFLGIIRAVIQNIRFIGSGRRMIGASTITQQVAKNFLLTNEASFERKIKEAILAIRIERAFSKEYIAELYLNQIYLGHYSYGIAAAALNYFNKSLDELTIAECAFLAALPKGPNNYDPNKRYDEAIARRNWVLSRMLEEGYITEEQAKTASEEPITLATRSEKEVTTDAEYFSEEVRRFLVSRYGENALYEGGLVVRTTVDPEMQKHAAKALRRGLITYDQRHGFRAPITHIELSEQDDWAQALQSVSVPVYAPSEWMPAIVLSVEKETVEIGLKSGEKGTLPLAEMKWAQKNMPDQTLGPEIQSADQVLSAGDVVWVEPVKRDAKRQPYPDGTYALRQLPNVEGAMVVLDPHTGRVLAMVGGYSFKRSQFNRAVQAKRQPGSSFKPFVYLAALDEGFTPSSLILDAPFVMDQGNGLGKWKPKNYSKRFYGPTTLRMGIEKSRNLMTVRLAKAIGIDKVVEYAKKFGISDDIPNQMSIALGSGETTVLRMATAYGMLVNGGKKIEPVLIDRIQDRTGTTVYNSDSRPCEKCHTEGWTGENAPKIPDIREQIEDPRSAYQIINIMTGVLQPGGSAQSLRSLGKTFAGKTGTSNSSFDGWFVGMTPDLVVAIFLGFDDPRTLGDHDTGGVIAAPVFKDFVNSALKNQPLIPFRVPTGIRFVRVNHKTGKPASPKDTDVVLEAFKADENWQGKIKGYIDGSEDTANESNETDERESTKASQTEEEEDNIPGIGGVF